MRKLSLLLALLFCFALPIRAQINPITGDITAAGNCAAMSNANCVIQVIPMNTSSVTVTTGNTFSATLAPEQSGDGGNTWTSAGSSITSPGVTTYSISSKNAFRIRASAYVSGTATVTIAYSTAAGGGVTSFNSRTGAVTPQSGDYTCSLVSNCVPDTRTVAGHALSGNVSIACADLTNAGTGCSGSAAPSGPAGGALSGTYPNPLTLTPLASYTFSVSGGTITATPNIAGGTIYTGTDLRSVWDSVAAAAPTGGLFQFKQGTYPCNTLDQESTGGFSNYYCVGIPSGGSSQYAQWFLTGESNAPLIDQFGTGVQTNGVILNVTSTAVASVAAHSKIMGIWARPDVTNGVGPSVYEQNIDIRVPTNQRGCETESDLSQALNSDYRNVVADTAVAQNSLVFPVEDTCTSWGGTDPGGLIGLTTTNSSKQENYMHRAFSVGADVGLDVRSEHSVLVQSFGTNSNHGIDYAVRGGGILASSSWMEVGCATTKRCLTIGSSATAGSQLNIDGLYFEDAASGSFAPTYHAIETTAGNTYGLITYQNTKEGVGVQGLTPLFDGGGGTNFLIQGEQGAGFYSTAVNNETVFGNASGSSLGQIGFYNSPNLATATSKLVLYIGYIGESALGISNKLAFGSNAALFGAYDISGNFAWGYSTPYPTTFAKKFNVGTSGQFNIDAGGNTAAPSFNPSSTQTTVSCSTSGTAIFSQPLQGSSDKKVLIHMAACLGTASYTYPTAFTNTPSVYASNNAAAGIATSVSTSAVTVTGTTTTGSLILEDY